MIAALTARIGVTDIITKVIFQLFQKPMANPEKNCAVYWKVKLNLSPSPSLILLISLYNHRERVNYQRDSIRVMAHIL